MPAGRCTFHVCSILRSEAPPATRGRPMVAPTGGARLGPRRPRNSSERCRVFPAGSTDRERGSLHGNDEGPPMTATIRSGSGVPMSGQMLPPVPAGRAVIPLPTTASIPTLPAPSGAEPSLFATLRRAGPAVAQPTATSLRARARCAWPTPGSRCPMAACSTAGSVPESPPRAWRRRPTPSPTAASVGPGPTPPATRSLGLAHRRPRRRGRGGRRCSRS